MSKGEGKVAQSIMRSTVIGRHSLVFLVYAAARAQC